MWFSVFGGTALNMEIMQQMPIVEAVKADVSTALFSMFDRMPWGMLMSGVATVLVMVFFVTSGDSAVLVLGMMTSGGNPNPSARVKIVWGLLVAGIAASLLLAGGLKAVQTATIVFVLPFAAVIALIAVSLWRGASRAMRSGWCWARCWSGSTCWSSSASRCRCGPGSIAAAITIGVSLAGPRLSLTLARTGGAVLALVAIAVLMYLAFGYAQRLLRPLGEAGTVIFLRLSAFILLCLGVQIVWDGVHELGVELRRDARSAG